MKPLPGLYNIDHARDEWSFFRRMGKRGRSLRRRWAEHYAHLRGWSSSGPLLLL